jgi:hypothetical protein
MKIVMNFFFRSRRARFSAVVSLRFGFFMCASHGSGVNGFRWQAKPKIVSCRSASARNGNLDGRVTVYYDYTSRPVLDDERCSFDREASCPFDGKGIGGVDDPKRLRFAVPT